MDGFCTCSFTIALFPIHLEIIANWTSMELQDLLLKGLFLPFKLGSNTPSDQNKVLGI